ncbi:MAG: dihydrodipicolinate synthase family protein [Armatimonadota bacterium]
MMAIEHSGHVWSATPTPFTDDMQIDRPSVQRLVEHHLKLGIDGLFLLGTCGEGAWMTDEQRREFVQSVISTAAGDLKIAVQVTDNSAARVLDNIERAAEDGADMAVIAQPYFFMNDTPGRIVDFYLEAIQNSPLPVGFYDRGKHSNVYVPQKILPQIHAQENVVMIKDSSRDPNRRDVALQARQERPDLLLLDGDEFVCATYIEAGYDGLLLGGGIFNGFIARQIIEAVHDGDMERANALQDRMNRLMWDVYGGKDAPCWLSGQKRLLVEMGIFSTWKSYLNYPLTDECVEAIEKAVQQDADILTPWKDA